METNGIGQNLMNDILIIGNGFDLAHGLPTKYGDFLAFVIAIRKKLYNHYGTKEIEQWGLDRDIANMINDMAGNHRDNIFAQKEGWQTLIVNNTWIDYFIEKCNPEKDFWVDFEREIYDILDKLMKFKQIKDGGASPIDLSSKWCGFKIHDYIINKLPEEYKKIEYIGCGEWYEAVLEILEKDLDSLELALEIYLKEFVEKIRSRKRLDIIDEIISNTQELKRALKVFSFNYTSTLSSLYQVDSDDISHIHGCLRTDLKKGKNKIVLGVDEFKNVPEGLEKAFMPFQKFYRRESKGISHSAMRMISENDEISGVYNYAWNFIENNVIELRLLEQMNKDPSDSRMVEDLKISEKRKFQLNHSHSKVYVFGHSLALSDKEYFVRLFMNDYTDSTIFYRDEEDRERLMRSLLLMIGNDEFRKRLLDGNIVFRVIS